MWRKLSTPSAGAVFAVLMICGCGNHDVLVSAVDKDVAVQKTRSDGPPSVDSAGLAVDSRLRPGGCYQELEGERVCGPICPYDCRAWERACRRADYFHRSRDIAMCDSCDEQSCQ